MVYKMNGNRIERNDFSLRTPFLDVRELEKVPHVPVPLTAEEYLVSVITERQNIEEVTQCTVDYKHFRKNQSLFYDQEILPQTADKLKPTKEWQQIQVADFSEVRSYVSRMRNHKEMGALNRVNILKDAKLLWWRNYFNKHKPDLSIVLRFTATQVDVGLEYLIKLMKLTTPGDTIDDYIGRWTYALLACLRPPLQSDTISTIRALAKQCWKLRSHINPESEDAAKLAVPMTLMICVVGHYYRQLDLADSLDLEG